MKRVSITYPSQPRVPGLSYVQITPSMYSLVSAIVVSAVVVAAAVPARMAARMMNSLEGGIILKVCAARAVDARRKRKPIRNAAVE